MTIHKLSAGDGYTYLTRHIAGGDVDRTREQDAAGYYAAQGNPPGVWLGRGAPLLGLAGQRVTEEQMRTLFGQGMHPNAEQMIAQYQAAHVHAGMTDKQIARVAAEARRAASLGRAFPTYATLEAYDKRVASRLGEIAADTGRAPTVAEVRRVRAQEATRGRGGVAGYDLVFAPVKSAALLWALDPRPHVRQAVWDAHQTAKASALELLEQHAAFTLVGAGGIAQVDTKGLVAVAFDHYDSRDGDPNLHTHVAVSNKICGTDGVWRALDGRAVYRIAVAASEHYNTAFQTALTQRLGVAWTPRTPRRGSEPIMEIAGIPTALIEHYSKRRNQLYARYETLIADYRREHGRDPSASVCHHLARQATLDTRRGKKPPRSLAAMLDSWTGELAHAFGPDALRTVMATVPDQHPSASLEGGVWSEEKVAEMVGTVLAGVAERRATWTEWNVRAEAERLLRTEPVPEQPVDDVVARIVTAALAPGASIRVEPPSLVDEPDVLRRADGTSVFHPHRGARYTSQAVLDAEQRLVTAASIATLHGLDPATVAHALAGFDLRPDTSSLDAGQRDLVTAFATNPAQVVVGIGAAGTGKTTAMRAFLHVTQAHGRRVIPLATSAASAAVLAADLGVAAENLHKFLHAHGCLPTPGNAPAADQQNGIDKLLPLPPELAHLKIRAGDVILVDEASMAGTFNLDRLRALAETHDATIRLLGDYRQLSAVESGGVLRLIATDVSAVELDTIHRFTDPAEAAATVKLRVGDTTALDFYQAHHRILGGSRHAMLDAVYTGWHTDIRNGQLSIMCAATNTDVTHLAARARLDRVTLGHVEAAGTPLHDGNQAGRDDWIVTRLNRRRLTCNHGRDFVRNGDGWTVTARHRDGSLTARNLRHHGTVRLPASYVAQHVELMYATTVHRAQGDTVDTTHALITPDVSRENLYVAATRGRHHTRLYTVTHDLLDLDEDRRLDRVRYDPDARAAREVLETILTTDTAELTATETLRTAQTDAASLATLMPRMIYAAEQAARPHHQHLIQQMFGPAMAARITADPAWPSVTHTLIAAEQQGWPADQLLAAAARSGPMTDARSAAELLTWRLDHALDTSPPPARLSPPEKAAANHYADLLDHYTGHSPRIGALLSTPPGLRTSRRTTEPDDAGYTAVDSAQLRGYANLVATHTGASPAAVTAHHTWPQLAARLTAWHRAGHDPADLFPGPERPSLIQVADVVRRHADRHHRALATPIPTALRQHDTVTAVLGAEAADTVRSQPGWPALDAALGRAHQAGHDTHHALTTVARHRSLGDAQDPALVLAWRLNRYLAAHPAPGNTADDRDAWATIGWILAAHENVGGDPETLLHDAPTRVPAYELAAHLNDHARAADTTRRTALGVPPWTPPATTGSHPEAAYHAQYLANSETAIAYRVRHLIDDALTHQPAWLAALGDQPTDTDAALTWHRHVGIVAAYRDQHHVTDDDPRHPLGPYVEPGHAGHRAYWHAAHAVIEAHASHSTTASAATGSHQMTVDLYLALNETAQHDVAATVVARLGALWFGSSATAHEAIIEPAYAARLRRALHDHGHLPESERRASTTDDPATSRTPRTQPQRPSQTRTARTPEQRRQRRSAAANAAEPAATQTQRPRPSDPNPEPPIHHRL